jgi:hypothetical protein
MESSFVPRKKLTIHEPRQEMSETTNDHQPQVDKGGRQTEVSDEELLKRFKSVTWFLQVEWGKIGYQIQRVGSPREIVALLKSIGNRGSRGEAEIVIRCLSMESSSLANPKAARLARKQLKNAEQETDRARSEYYKQGAIFQKCTAAMTSAIDQAKADFNAVVYDWPWFGVFYVLAERLEVRAAKDTYGRATADLGAAEDRQREITERLLSDEGAVAQDEFLKFVRNERYSGTLEHLAAAMAGLPELGCIRSLRRCSKLQPRSPQLNYRVFQFLESLVQGSRSLNPETLETECREKILSMQVGNPVRYQLGWNWGDLRLAIVQIDWRKISKDRLPYVLTANFENNMMRGKSQAEVVLAERDRLVTQAGELL